MGDAAGGEVGLTQVRLRRKDTLFPDYGFNFFLPFRKDEIKLWLTVFKAKHVGFQVSVHLNLSHQLQYYRAKRREYKQVLREGDWTLDTPG